MDDSLFRELLDFKMVNDPWPWSEAAEFAVLGILSEQSSLRGYDDWIDAYHEFQPVNDL